MKIGTKVKVKVGKGHWHEGEYLGQYDLDPNQALVGVLKTTIPGVSIKPGKKYISVFHSNLKKLEEIK